MSRATQGHFDAQGTETTAFLYEQGRHRWSGKFAALSAVGNSCAICADEGYLDRSMNANRF